MNRVVKMKTGPFGNHVVGPGFPVDVTALVGEGKFVTLQTTELWTDEFEEHNHVDTVVTAAGFPNAVREILHAGKGESESACAVYANAQRLSLWDPNDQDSRLWHDHG